MSVKVVGRRKAARGLQATDRLLQLAVELRSGKPYIPRGVHRFKTFQEAQEWSLEMMTRPGVPKSRGRRR